MGLFSRAYGILDREIYGITPEISCSACGECCVSPHITLVEFCYLISPILSDPARLHEIISKVTDTHPSFPGNLRCRFLDETGQCMVYETRPLVCRLHGRRALRKMGLKHHVQCQKTESSGRTLAEQDIYGLMDHLAALNQRFYLHYTQPYWLSALNIETWLTILFEDWPQAYFQSLKNLMVNEFGSVMTDLASMYTQKVRLAEKLDVIEEFHKRLAIGSWDNLVGLLRKIQADFPDTEAYYYFEAEMYLTGIENREQGLNNLNAAFDFGGGN